MPNETNKPRVATICSGILLGKYDKDLAQIQNAIDDRRQDRLKELEDLVREVAGPDARIHTARPLPNSPTIGTTPGIVSGASPTPASLTPAEPDPAEGLVVEGETEDTFESRSPIIG